MPGPVDYTSQLEQIVKALNRPSILTWMIAIMSAFLGFLVSILTQVFQHWYCERRARSKMRMIIYSELGSMYSHLVHFHDVKTRLPEQEDAFGATRISPFTPRIAYFPGGITLPTPTFSSGKSRPLGTIPVKQPAVLRRRVRRLLCRCSVVPCRRS
jgi:hypothetical protein